MSRGNAGGRGARGGAPGPGRRAGGAGLGGVPSKGAADGDATVLRARAAGSAPAAGAGLKGGPGGGSRTTTEGRTFPVMPARTAVSRGASAGRGFSYSPRSWDPPPPLEDGDVRALEEWHDGCWARAAADERLFDGMSKPGWAQPRESE